MFFLIFFIPIAISSCGEHRLQKKIDRDKSSLDTRYFLFGNNSIMIVNAINHDMYYDKCNFNAADLIINIFRDELSDRHIFAEQPTASPSNIYIYEELKQKGKVIEYATTVNKTGSKFSAYIIDFRYKDNQAIVSYVMSGRSMNPSETARSHSLNFNFNNYNGTNTETCYNDLKNEIKPIAERFVNEVILGRTPINEL